MMLMLQLNVQIIDLGPFMKCILLFNLSKQSYQMMKQVIIVCSILYILSSRDVHSASLNQAAGPKFTDINMKKLKGQAPQVYKGIISACNITFDNCTQLCAQAGPVSDAKLVKVCQTISTRSKAQDTTTIQNAVLEMKIQDQLKIHRQGLIRDGHSTCLPLLMHQKSSYAQVFRKWCCTSYDSMIQKHVGFYCLNELQRQLAPSQKAQIQSAKFGDKTTKIHLQKCA